MCTKRRVSALRIGGNALLQFEELLNEEEAKEMIDRCRSFGKFERSLVPLALHPLRLPRRATPPLGCHVVLHPLRLPHRATPP